MDERLLSPGAIFRRPSGLPPAAAGGANAAFPPRPPEEQMREVRDDVRRSGVLNSDDGPRKTNEERN